MRPLTENGEWGTKQKKIYDLDENGEKIPVIDKKTGQQKVDKQNSKQWKLAYAEVIGYNRKNLESKLQNESRQHDKQQIKTKRREEEI